MGMTKKKFVRECLTRGYARTGQAIRYCQENPKGVYTEEDLLIVQRTYAWIDEDFCTPISNKSKNALDWDYNGYRSDDFHVVFG